MILEASTTVYVTSEDGTNRMTLQGVIQAVNGGMRLDKVQMATDRNESDNLEMRRVARADAIAKIEAMSIVELAQHSLANDLIADRERKEVLESVLKAWAKG